MADVKIRNLDDALHETYRRMAEQNGISLEEQLRRVLSEHVRQERQEMVRVLRADLERMRAKYGVMEDSTPGIREDRDTRG
jgi:plasmid stability protein